MSVVGALFFGDTLKRVLFMTDSKFLSLARSQVHRAQTLWLQLAQAPTIHCVGDSHTSVFQHIQNARSLPHTILKFCIINGATATGIANPNSQTQARPIFEKYIAQIPAGDYLLVSLGEVDCGFVIWYRSQKYGTLVQAQFEQALTGYYNFLKQCKSEGHPKLMVMSVPLPTIKDGQDWGEVANRRREIKTTLAERTAMTLKFNSHLRQFAGQNDIPFLDVEPHLYNAQTGLLDKRYLNANPLDHHLEHSAVAPVLVQLLKQQGFR